MPEDQLPPAPEPADEYRVNAAHMIRTAQLIHVQLSAMADQKASILMAATFVIFTITLGQAQGEAVPLPLLILGGAAFFSAVCAVLAVLPATNYRRPGGLNLLFFGSFARLEEEDYVDQLTDQLKSDDGMYRMVARDIYQNGSVLARKKYRLLGFAYRIFLAGLVASAITFVITYGAQRG
ncbi:MAG TPA: Pycsar system effector family protein [Allosphingosinicella sp.]|nr:Pycsar system effector family protein [Allosphingosinicella sp.]